MVPDKAEPVYLTRVHKKCALWSGTRLRDRRVWCAQRETRTVAEEARSSRPHPRRERLVQWEGIRLRMSTALPEPEAEKEPVFLFRRLRTLLGMTQKQAAWFATVAVHQYRRLESQQKLPKLFRLLNQIARAFGMSFRCNLLSRTATAEIPEVKTLSVAYRSPHLFVALMNGDRTMRLRRLRLSRAEDVFARIEPMLVELDCDVLVIEPELLTNGRRGRFQGEIHKLTLAEAKTILFPGEPDVTHRELFEDLVHHYPELRPNVKMLATGRLAMADAWRVNQLVPVALGVAVHRRDGDHHSA